MDFESCTVDMYKIKYVEDMVSQLYIQASDSLETNNVWSDIITCSSFPPLRYVAYVSLGVIPQRFDAGWQKTTGSGKMVRKVFN